MGRSYTQDALSKMIGDDSDSDSTPVGIYEIEETSQEMCTWPTSSSRHSPLSNTGLSSRPAYRTSRAFGPNFSHMRSARDSNFSDSSPLFQRTTTNLFGRDLEEAGADLRGLLRPPQRSARNVTPSLTSDDTRTSSRTSSNFTSPKSVPWELPPLQPPITPSADKVVEPVIAESPKDAVVSTAQRARIEHTEIYPALPVVQIAPSAVSVESRSAEGPPPTPKPPLPPIGSEKEDAYNWDFSSLSSTISRIQDEIPALSTQPPKAAAPSRSPWVAELVPYCRVDEERDEILGDDEDDSYIPGPEDKRSRTSTTKQRRKVVPGGVKCKHCTAVFTRNFDMLRHVKSVHEAQTQDKILARTCPCCNEVLSRSDAFKRHILKVPSSCIRAAKLQGKPEPPKQHEELYKLCREGNPPLAGSFRLVA